MTTPSSTRKFDNRVIRASAGTGKTYRLTNRFLGLLRNGTSSDDILATTFTRKAAGEILDRVLYRLASAVEDEDDRRRMSEALEDDTLSRDDCLEMLVELTRKLHRLRIATLDSFFSQIAGSFGLDIGLASGWQIVDELEDQQMRREAIQRVLQSDATSEMMTLVSLLTKGEAQRSLSELLTSTVSELYSVFQVTSGDVWDKVPRGKTLMPDELSQAVLDLESVPLPNDKRFAKARSGDCVNAVVGDWEAFIGKGLAGKVMAGEQKYYGKEIDETVVRAYRPLLQHAKSVLLAQLADQNEATYRLLEKFDLHYEQLKRQRRSMRFDDVTRVVASAVANHDVDRLGFRLDGYITHLLLDEFQDTSLEQWQAIRPFAEEVTKPDESRSFFCVGDLKQAIYGWRGGVAEIFDAVSDQLPGIRSETMETSYRSSQVIIDVVNEVFAGITSHQNLKDSGPAIELWCEQFKPHKTALDLRGYVLMQTTQLPSDVDAQAEVTLRIAAERIAELTKSAPGREIGVLVRRNRAIASLIYHLRRLGVDASEEGGNPLTDSAAVRVIMSLLQLADHPSDTIAAYHVATSPLGSEVGMTDPQNEHQRHAAAQRIRRSLLEAGYGPSIDLWSRPLLTLCDRRESNRLEQLVALAFSYHDRATTRTGDFLELVEHQKIADPSGAKVRVMTIHQAKGLEFDIVVLPDLDAQLLGQRGSLVVGRPGPTDPIDRVCRYRNEAVRQLLPKSLQECFTATEQRGIAEALCVLYVALTRAKHALHMYVAPSKENEKTIPKTYAGLLRAALTDQQKLGENIVAFQSGNVAWHSDSEGEPIASRHDATDKVTRVLQAVALAPPTGRPSRGMARVQPSGLEGGKRVRLQRVFEQSSSAAQRGTVLHACFEQVNWLDERMPHIATLKQIARQHVVQDEEAESLAREAVAFMKKPWIARLLTQSAYTQLDHSQLPQQITAKLATKALRLDVRNEWRFALATSEGLIIGTIDRLILMFDGDQLVAADIIDFKSDDLTRAGDASLESKTEFYRPQLVAYRQAVGRQFALNTTAISTRLVFLAADEVVDVERD